LPAEWWNRIHPEGVESCVFVETRASDAESAVAERWLDSFDFVRGFIAAVAVDGQDIHDVLARWSPNPKFRGVRAHREDGGPGLLDEPRLAEALRVIADAGKLFEFLVMSAQLRRAVDLTAQVPGLLVVIEPMSSRRWGMTWTPPGAT
jgi:predicted TIM-barrel fold metal-dependent hydrolase